MEFKQHSLKFQWLRLSYDVLYIDFDMVWNNSILVEMVVVVLVVVLVMVLVVVVAKGRKQ